MPRGARRLIRLIRLIRPIRAARARTPRRVHAKSPRHAPREPAAEAAPEGGITLPPATRSRGGRRRNHQQTGLFLAGRRRFLRRAR
ncbi:hypothetical protein ACX84Z_07700, partial [Burkholderia pseudomallei]